MYCQILHRMMFLTNFSVRLTTEPPKDCDDWIVVGRVTMVRVSFLVKTRQTATGFIAPRNHMRHKPRQHERTNCLYQSKSAFLVLAEWQLRDAWWFCVTWIISCWNAIICCKVLHLPLHFQTQCHRVLHMFYNTTHFFHCFYCFSSKKSY